MWKHHQSWKSNLNWNTAPSKLKPLNSCLSNQSLHVPLYPNNVRTRYWRQSLGGACLAAWPRLWSRSGKSPSSRFWLHQLMIFLRSHQMFESDSSKNPPFFHDSESDKGAPARWGDGHILDTFHPKLSNYMSEMCPYSLICPKYAQNMSNPVKYV